MANHATTLRILTLNVWGLPWPLSMQKRRRFARIGRHFAEQAYDLVGLQEVWRPWGHDLPVPHLRLPSSRGDAGLALSGRLAPAAAEPSVVPYQHGAGTDRLKQKGVLLSRAQGVLVAVTHLQAHKKGAAVRAQQVRQLLEVLEAHPGPAVLMGDFNFWPDLDAASEGDLLDAGWRDTADGLEAPTYLRRNPFTPHAGQRFDRIYVRDGDGQRLETRAHRVLPRVWSDHQPVLAEVAMVDACQ